MLENFQRASWGPIPPLSMSSLLPHDLCHGWRSSCWLPAFFQRRNTDGQQAHEKMLNITNHWENANQNHSEKSPHTCQNGFHQKQHKKCWQGCGEKGTLEHCWWECKLAQAVWKTVWRVLRNGTIIWFSNSTPGYISEKKKTLIRKSTNTLMFTAALFTTAKTWKQPKSPWSDECIKKMGGVHY